MATKFSKPVETLNAKAKRIKNSTDKTAGAFLSRLAINLLEKRISTNFNDDSKERHNLERWNSLVQAFLKDPRNSISQNKASLTAARGNLNKELMTGEISWKVFFKFLRLLQAVRVKFSVEIHLPNKRVIGDEITVNFGNAYITEGEDTELIFDSGDVQHGRQTPKDKQSSGPDASSISPHILG